MDDFLIWILLFVGLFGSYAVAAIMGFFYGYRESEEFEESNNFEPAPDLHCFQCEIEMPTKSKNGILRCANCGLCH